MRVTVPRRREVRNDADSRSGYETPHYRRVPVRVGYSQRVQLLD
jgi:hypothetical protein